VIDLGLSTFALAAIFCAFLVAGTVKGVIGAGLPMVAVPTVAMVLDPALAVAILIVPVVVSNVWQGFQGGLYREAFQRFWPFLFCLCIFVFGGAQILANADPRAMSLVMGIVVIVICAVQLLVGRIMIPVKTQHWLNPVAGAVCGIFGGVAGMLALTIVYSAALRLPKDLLISLLALIALCGTTPLYASLILNDVLGWREVGLSALGLVPVLSGMVFGKWIRDRISQESFERILMVALVVIGLNLIRKGLF